MQRLIAIFILCACLLGLAGCRRSGGDGNSASSSPTDDPSTSSSASLSVPTVPPDSQATEPSAPDEPEPLPEFFSADAYAPDQPYTADEIVPFFALTEEQVLSLWGEPDEIIRSDFYSSDNGSYEYHYQSGTVFCFESYSSLSEGTLYAATMTDDLAPAPRGVKIGDTVETVRSRFPSPLWEQSQPIPDEDDASLSYRMLYGEYVHMSDFGLAEYRNGALVSLLYSNQGTALKFCFSPDETLASVVYTIPLT